ncbi:MAG: transglutaminase domain-containing protein [Pseudomonadota bacterium]
MPRFLEHNAWTDPGRHRAAVDALDADIRQIVETVGGLMVHCDHLEYYESSGIDAASASRATLPLEARLDRIFARFDVPLGTSRPPADREIGTCRDYAVMLCGMLRQKSVPARVRCGFAAYFSPERFEDHWICEFQSAPGTGWVRADAQLDREHRAHLGIDFDPCAVPEEMFLTAAEAWRKVRAGSVSAELFGHGEAAGEWFLWVNLARDCLALDDVPVSPWDTWRDCQRRDGVLTDAERRRCDVLARDIDTSDKETAREPFKLKPFWV